MNAIVTARTPCNCGQCYVWRFHGDDERFYVCESCGWTMPWCVGGHDENATETHRNHCDGCAIGERWFIPPEQSMLPVQPEET